MPQEEASSAQMKERGAGRGANTQMQERGAGRGAVAQVVQGRTRPAATLYTNPADSKPLGYAVIASYLGVGVALPPLAFPQSYA